MPAPLSFALTVSALNRQVREHLEGSFPLLWVAGEISNLVYAASGHVYFSLKDASAQVRCTLWRQKAQLLGWRLCNGQQVEIRALVTLYEPRGEFQLSVESVRRAGQGDLFQQFLQLKARLEADGLFSAADKRPLPAFPQRIAIVTSPQAAALRDVVTTLSRRAPHIRLTLYPTPVQGEGASQRIAEALALAASANNDLIILCRGGGSIEDMWAFNEEVVARALRNCPLPVICGIGHETDFTIADFAADLRAPTPTAAAELASPDRQALLARLAEMELRLCQRTNRQVLEAEQKLDWLGLRLLHPAQRLSQRRAELARLEARLQQSLAHSLDTRRHRLQLSRQALHAARPRSDRPRQALKALTLRLAHAGQNALTRAQQGLQALAAGLEQLDPEAVLTRGYSIVRLNDGHLVRDATQLSPGVALQLAFGRGTARATVDEIVAAKEENQELLP